MQEKLLQFIWQYSLYRPDAIFTTRGEPVQIIHPGTLNRDAGPDFSNARIRIGKTTLAGNIELHVRTSDWARHGHSADTAYRNIILHAVYENDVDATPAGIPVIEMKGRVPEYVLEQYSGLLHTTHELPCHAHLKALSPITKESWLSRLLVERWEQKLERWKAELQACGGSWQELLYQKLAENFGFKVNAAPFKMLAQSLPLSILQKQSAALAIEALVFGQSGLLQDADEDDYVRALRQEYAFHRQKHHLNPLPAHLWKYLRMRPANFPTVRLAQFAALMQQVTSLFSRIQSAPGTEALTALLDVTASKYWDTHYRFGAAQEKASPKKLGTSTAENIVMNTIAPALFLYAHTQGRQQDQERALEIMDGLPAEDNHILRLWQEWGWKPLNAAQSQAQLQLYNHYCAPKRCLECALGLKIIRTGPDKVY